MIQGLKKKLDRLTAEFNQLNQEDKKTPGKNQLALNALGEEIYLLKSEIGSLETTDNGNTDSPPTN